MLSVLADETVTYAELVSQARAKVEKMLVDAGVPVEYTSAVQTALVEDGSVGYSFLQTKALFEQGVTPAYANELLKAVEHYTTDQAIELFHLGVGPGFAVAALLLDLPTSTICEYWEAGVAPEYLPNLAIPAEAC